MSEPARVTAAQRRFSPEDLGALDHDHLRKLWHVLLTATDARVIEARRLGDYDEWRLELRPLWRERTARVRLFHRPITQDDLDRVATLASSETDFEVVALAPHGAMEGAGHPAVHLLMPDQMIARLERSALIAWPDRIPTPALERLELASELTTSPATYDRLGIRWLPWLAHNELPPDVSEGPPQDLFEIIAFRMLTMCFRMGGRRYGTSFRGRRLPDALLTWESASQGRRTALLDCKASGDGYLMTSDHALRFSGYPDRVRTQEGEPDLEISAFVVLSSEFSGPDGARHPFNARRDELAAKDLRLMYLRAADLARAAVLVEALQLSPSQRQLIAWDDLVSLGQPTFEQLEAAIREVA